MALLARRWRRVAADRRKQDTRRKIELGGLVLLADLGDLDPLVLVGGLLAVAHSVATNPAAVSEWRARGLAQMTARRRARYPHMREVVASFPGFPGDVLARRLEALGLYRVADAEWRGVADFAEVEELARRGGGNVDPIAD